MQELHDRQHLHQDVLLASLPAQLPARHHLHKVSSCKNNLKKQDELQLLQSDHGRVRLLCPHRLQGHVQDRAGQQ